MTKREHLLGISEVSEWLDVPVSSLYAQRHAGRGVGALAIRVGRRLRWRPADVERWLDEQQIEQTRREVVR